MLTVLDTILLHNKKYKQLIFRDYKCCSINAVVFFYSHIYIFMRYNSATYYISNAEILCFETENIYNDVI
ncbi:hypothetical protein J3D55_000258 [Chryseobacterium ginsenosidimutans]|nr:hypothetical protein [Chryseobacterium ginsenosidimutans]